MTEAKDCKESKSEIKKRPLDFARGERRNAILKRYVIIIWVIVTVHCAAKSIIRTRIIWRCKGIFFIRIHLRLEFEWGIKVIQVIKFTQSTHKF